MKAHILKTITILPKPLEEVFDFFSNAENLNRLTPPQLHFHIETALPIKMHQGTLIDYTIRLSGISMKWRTLISVWHPPFRFVDTQLKGPYKVWIHEHHFESLGKDTKMTDTIQFLSPGGIFEPLVHHLFVKKKVKEIFEYRAKQLGMLFQVPSIQ